MFREVSSQSKLRLCPFISQKSLRLLVFCVAVPLVMSGCGSSGSGTPVTGTTAVNVFILFDPNGYTPGWNHRIAVFHGTEYNPEERFALARMPLYDRNGLDAYGAVISLTDGETYDFWGQDLTYINGDCYYLNIPATYNEVTHDGSPTRELN